MPALPAEPTFSEVAPKLSKNTTWHPLSTKECQSVSMGVDADQINR